MKVLTFYCALALISLISFTNAQFGIDWSSFNDVVNRHVQGIDNNVMNSINSNIASQMNSMNSKIAKMQNDMSQIESKIQDEVRSNLEPVNALRIKENMAHGVGGITIATYGDRFTVIYKDGQKYACPGDIIDDVNSIRCTSPLTTSFTLEEQICANNAYSRIHNIYCFGDKIEFNCINRACRCKGGRLFTMGGLKKICSPNFGTNSYAKFVYYPDESNVNHIPLPNPNRYVYCAEDSHSKCTWYSSGLF